MTSSPGHYVYVSPGRDDVCGLFIVGSINQIVAIEFTSFNIDCDNEGLLVVGVQSVINCFKSMLMCDFINMFRIQYIHASGVEKMVF